MIIRVNYICLKVSVISIVFQLNIDERSIFSNILFYNCISIYEHEKAPIKHFSQHLIDNLLIYIA